jgi:hypothetical protein
MSPEDEKALAAFVSQAAERASIREYVRASDGSVQRNSVLAQDDVLFNHHPTSQVVWLAMISASEHLDIVEAICDLAPRRTFVSAPFTTVRGALIGASQALWILGAPLRMDRQQRSLSIAIEYLQQRIGYQTEQLKVCNEEQRARSQRQIDEVLVPTLTEAKNLVKKGYRFADTQVIAQAVQYRFQDNIENTLTTVDLHWRRLGGDAHVLGWPLMFGDLEWRGGDPSHLGPVTVKGKVADLVETAAWAFQILRRAVELHKKMSLDQP